MTKNSSLERLVESQLGTQRATVVLTVLAVPPQLGDYENGDVSRAIIAYALNVILMHGLLDRVPSGAAYVADLRSEGGNLTFDHGALRTVLFPEAGTGDMQGGEKAFTRFLRPLGYRQAGHYPLPALRMTGRSYAHEDLPEAIPQIFISELHVDQYSPAFQAAAHRVFDSSVDPLTAETMQALDALHRTRALPFERARGLVAALVAAFARTHAEPTLADYKTLKSESAEAAWIATEGNAFNHVTDRVADVHALAVRQRALGRPIKDVVEVSQTGRVRQTAFRADLVRRRFRTPEGYVERDVPGSFYEFISRDIVPDDKGECRLDLAFDTGNAQGIFKMTG